MMQSTAETETALDALPAAMAADVRRAADVMARGGVVVYPTDTVWGIGCDARCAEAVRRIYGLKGRAGGKALITLVADAASLWAHSEAPQEAVEAALRGARGPLTLVLPGARGVCPGLLAQDGSLGMRVTAEAWSAALCRLLGAPVVSTSANLSGRPAPGCFDEIAPEVLAGADYVAASRRDAPPGRPSAVARLKRDGSLEWIRR